MNMNNNLYYCGVDQFNSISHSKLCKFLQNVGTGYSDFVSTLNLFVYSKYPNVFTWFAQGFGTIASPLQIFPDHLQIDQVQISNETVFGLSTVQNQLYKLIFKYQDEDDHDVIIGHHLTNMTPTFTNESLKLIQIAANDTDLFAIDDDGGFYKGSELLFRFEGMKITKIACGFDHVLMLNDAGAVYAYGNGSRGQLGQPDIILKSEHPVRIEFFDDLPCTIKDVVCGGWHSLVLTSDGDVYSFGWNSMGQLGHSKESLSEVIKDPYPVDLGSGDNPIVAVAAGARHSLALLKNGDIYSWGWNSYYQLGTGDNIDRATPTLIKDFNEKPLKIASGRWGSFIYSVRV